MPFKPGSRGRKANTKINNAVRDGKMAKPSKCSKCGASGQLQAHHPDYGSPGKVIWVCQKCHSKIHGAK